MITQATILERVDGALETIPKLDFTDEPAETKKQLAEALRKATTGYGKAADELNGAFNAAKTMLDEVREIKRNNFESKEAFAEALKNHANTSLDAVQALREEVVAKIGEDYGKDAGNDPTGNLGTRSSQKFPFKVTKTHGEMKEGEIVELAAGDVVKSFIAGPHFQTAVNGDKDVNIAQLQRKHIAENMHMELQEPKPGVNALFYKIYRLGRPTIQRAINKARKEKVA